MIGKLYRMLPYRVRRRLSQGASKRSVREAAKLVGEVSAPTAWAPPVGNPLWDHFAANREGPGIWKWRHYFDAYHRHFQKFVGRPVVNVLEIGTYSGGSLPMWRSYFGPGCTVYGVDIEASCRVYAGDGVKVIIGDQGSTEFWAKTLPELPPLDIIIDDGGHQPHQQRTTVDAAFTKLRPGGVYVCEDVHHTHNDFAVYMAGLSRQLHAFEGPRNDSVDPDRAINVQATPFQSAVHSMHFYPFLAIVEKNETSVGEFVAPKRGTVWEPFL